MNPTTYTRSVILTCSVLCLAGCMDRKKELEPRPNVRPMIDAIGQAEQDWIWVSGQRWLLNSIENNTPITDSTIVLEFKEHTWLAGDAGCNHYTASYIRKADIGLQVKEIISTRMFCNEPLGIMQQEARYFQLLKTIDAYHAEPEQLTLFADGRAVLSYGIDPVPQTP